ncbi:unnamed protein product [Amoebophrya sp. A120]|nr:unnamed protein product [Amoebophrya sp. A120]|eukprot:GSA120T00011740001.1
MAKMMKMMSMKIRHRTGKGAESAGDGLAGHQIKDQRWVDQERFEEEPPRACGFHQEKQRSPKERDFSKDFDLGKSGKAGLQGDGPERFRAGGWEEIRAESGFVPEGKANYLREVMDKNSIDKEKLYFLATVVVLQELSVGAKGRGKMLKESDRLAIFL